MRILGDEHGVASFESLARFNEDLGDKAVRLDGNVAALSGFDDTFGAFVFVDLDHADTDDGSDDDCEGHGDCAFALFADLATGKKPMKELG